MKRNVLIAAIAATLFSTAAMAFGPQGYGPGFGRGGMGGAGPGAGAGTCMQQGALEALGLTAGQREQIAAIRDEVSPKQVALMETMRELRAQAHQSGQRPSGEGYQAMADVRRQMQELMAQSRERIEAVLTPEQRAQWRPGWRGGPFRG